MPVLIVSENTWPHDGFSRKRSTLPSSSVTTIPNSSGFSTDLSPIVTAAPFSLWKSTILLQVDVAERVARDDEERVVERVRGEPHGAGRAERALLDRVLDVQAEARAVAEVGADRLRQERDGDDDVLEAVLAQQLEDVLHARLADDRDHRLRLVRGERAKARPLAARHHDGLHANASRFALIAYSRERRRTRARGRSRRSRAATSCRRASPSRSRATRTAATSRPCRAGSPGTRSRGPSRSACPRARRGRAPGSAARATAAGRRGSSRITAQSIISRSASGSAIFPNADSTCQRRARKPSTWSVTPATPKTIAAGHDRPPSQVVISHT